jgi:hypothetical protein
VDATTVYWGQLNGPVMKASLDGGPAVALAPNAMVTGLAVDAAHVYYLDNNKGTMVSLPTGGGAATTLASNQFNDGLIVLDPSNVYWANTEGILGIGKN